MSSPTAVCCSRATPPGWDARACRRVTLNREISGGSMVRRQRHFRRMDERCSWPKCCEAEVQQARSISEGLTVRMPFGLATAIQRICHLTASGCWLRRSVLGSTGSSCRPVRDRQEPYRPDPLSSGSRRTFSRMDVGLCSEGGRKITASAFMFRMSKADWSGRSPRRTREPSELQRRMVGS